MTKFDIKSMAAALAAAHNISESDAENFLKVVCDVVVDALRHDGQVKIKGLGTFKLIGVPEREMIDVNSGERITVEARNRISFSPDSVLRDIINKPFVFFETVVLNDGVVFDDEADTEEADDEEQETDEQQMPDTDETDDTAADASDTLSAETEEDNFEIRESEDMESDTPESDDTPVNPVPEEIQEGTDGGEDVIVEPSAETVSETEDITDETDNHTVADEETQKIQEEQDIEETEDEHPETEDEHPETEDEHPETEDKHPETEARETPSRQDDTPAAVNEALSDARSVMDEIESGNINDDDESVKGLYPEKKSHNILLNIFLVVAALIAVASILYGTYGTQWFEENDVVMIDTTVVNSQSYKMSPVDTLQTDTVKEMAAASDSVQSTDSIAKTKVKKQGTIDPDFYDALDVRVRTGAYRIVGIYKTIEVVKGQTFKSITKAYLGEGMECYMEALNGVKSVQPGDTLLIPKLKWRKKIKK